MEQANGTNGAMKDLMITSAEIVLPSKDIARETEFWDGLGFRMDQIVRISGLCSNAERLTNVS